MVLQALQLQTPTAMAQRRRRPTPTLPKRREEGLSDFENCFFMALLYFKVNSFVVVLFCKQSFKQGLVQSLVGDEYASERVRGFGSPMNPYSRAPFDPDEQRHGSLEPWRDGDDYFVGSCGDDEVGVFEGWRKGTIFGFTVEVAGVEESPDGFPFWFFAKDFV